MKKEIKEIIKAYDKALSDKKQTALATVVHVDGSSYRREGARMLITETGEMTGAISGGCLEGDALKKAQMVMERRKPMLITYDTTGEGDSQIGVGLGCKGIIHILIEPIDPRKSDSPIHLLKEFIRERQSAVLVTLFSMKNKSIDQPGTCLFINKNSKIKGSLSDESLRHTLINDAENVLKNKASITKIYRKEDELTGFIELLTPQVSLVVVGAGNDAIPVMEMSDVLGWETTIVDPRENYATTRRFPRADKVIVSKSENFLKHVSIDEYTAVLLMTHNYNCDLTIVKQLIPFQLPYIGMLGPRKKTEQLMDDLQKDRLSLKNGQIKHIYGPVGLDIGAESPEEIALSVIAEIKTAFTGKPGSHLREKKDPIHTRKSEAVVHS